MLGNLWSISLIIAVAMLSSAALYKSYKDIETAKHIKQSYEIVSDVKTLIAKQYNKNPNEITREEIIAALPEGQNWELVLLSNKDTNSNLDNSAFVDENGNFILSDNQRVELLALKSKLKSVNSESVINQENSTTTFRVIQKSKDLEYKDKVLEKTIKNVIYELTPILYDSSLTTAEIKAKIKYIEDSTPYDILYQDFRKTGETTISDTVLENRQKEYFKNRVIEKLRENESGVESNIYFLIKDEL